MVQQRPEKPDLLILSSSKSYPVAEGARDNLKEYFEVTLWREGFFSQVNEAPLNTFLKKLIYFDVAVLIMGPDDVRIDPENQQHRINVPRDNVIFELGAAMARFGTHKTFILVPEKPEVKLPSYFKGLSTLEYEERKDHNYQAATGAACVSIRNTVRQLAERIFHSDLPALGLTFGYFFNFVKPIYTSLLEPQGINTGDGSAKWKPADGFTLTVIMPNKFMTRVTADKFMSKLGTENVHVLLKNGRDVSVYVLKRPHPGLPLHIVDIPTTLFTSLSVIRRVDAYWGAGDSEFLSRLEMREIASFQRQFLKLIDEDEYVDPGDVFVIPQDELTDHILSISRLQ